MTRILIEMKGGEIFRITSTEDARVVVIDHDKLKKDGSFPMCPIYKPDEIKTKGGLYIRILELYLTNT